MAYIQSKDDQKYDPHQTPALADLEEVKLEFMKGKKESKWS